jgi:hypothetical protein
VTPNPDGTPGQAQPLISGWEAIIVPGSGKSFRENVKIFHEIGNETEPIFEINGRSLPTNDPHTHSYRPGSRAINYRSEPFMDRLNLNPDQKSQTYGSYTFGDAPTTMPRGYLGDPTKFRIVHGSTEVFHVYHLHGGGIRWRFNPKADLTYDYADTGLNKHPRAPRSNSLRLDSQSLGPGESYDLEIEGGAGGVQRGAGEFLFHCHVAEHYFSGMWGFWRVHDTLQPDLAPLPDRTRLPGAVDSSALIGQQMPDGTTITAANIDSWIRPQRPPQGQKRLGPDGFSQDAAVMDWTVDNSTGQPIYLGEVEDTRNWPNPRIGTSAMPYPRDVSGPALVNYRSVENRLPGPNMFSSLANGGDPTTPLLRAYRGDPTRVHVLGSQGTEQMHAVNLGGLSWPVDPFVTHSAELSTRGLGPQEKLDAFIVGGAGGRSRTVGDFVYQDRRLGFTEAGMWGLIRVLSDAAGPIKPLDGLTCLGQPSLAGAAAPASFRAVVSPTGSGQGTVTSSPAGINCPSACSTDFPVGSSIVLTATAAPGSVFAGWGGACAGTAATCQVTMSQAQSVTATFRANPPPAASALLVGTPAVQPNADSNPAGLAEAFQYTNAQAGTVTALSLYVDSGNTATRAVVGLYADNAGAPGALLTSGTITAPVAGQFNQVSVPSAAVTAGTRHWIAVLGPAGSGMVRFRDLTDGAGGGLAQVSTQTNLTALPATWSGGARFNMSPMSAFALGS